MSGAKPIEVPAEEARPWEPPALPKPDPWIEGDIHRWMTEEPPPVRWLVEGLIPAGVPGVFAARANAGKSMTALLIALGLASGRGVLGRAVSPDAPRGAIYVGLEDDQPEFQRRFRRGLDLLQEGGDWAAADDEALRHRFLPLFPNRGMGVSLSLDAQWENIAQRANAIPGGCGLIVLDTLARLSEGDENSASEIRPFMDAQAALVQATGASVIAIHHVGKGNDTPSDKKLWQRLHPEALRGSSAIEAGARFILTMAALSPQEAAMAALDDADALNGGLVALKLAKASQSEKGLTLLLERRHAGQAGAGFLVPHPDSERALAAIQGDVAARRLNKRDRVLLTIAEAGHLGNLDQKAAADEIWPGAEKPKGQWDKQLSGLRKQRWLKGPHLTDAGWVHAESLGFRRKNGYPTKPEEALFPQGSSNGSLETEETEEMAGEGPSFHSNLLGSWSGRKTPDLLPPSTFDGTEPQW